MLKELREKMSLTHTGKSSGALGKHWKLSKVTRKRQSIAAIKRGNKTHAINCSCYCCKAKRGETFGKNSSMYGKKGKDSPNYGKKQTQEQKDKLSKSHTGKKLSEEHKKKIGLSNKGKISKRKGSRLPEEHKEKIRIGRVKQVFPIKDTSIEIKMQNILTEHNIKFEKHKAIVGQPDIFIEPNICIFCDGDYWHNRPGAQERDTYVNKTLKDRGYKILRFWEHDINNDIAKCLAVINME